MSYTRQQLIDWVASRMDESLPDNLNEGDTVIVSPISNVGDELDKAAETIIKNVRREHLMPLAKDGSDSKVDPDDDDPHTGVIHAPVDMSRFLRLRMSDWRRPVDHLISTDDPAYLHQQNKHLRGSIYKPTASLVPYGGAESNMGIEYYITKEDDHEVSEFLYVPTTTAENMPDVLIDGLVWLTVSTALSILRFSNEAKYAHERYMASVGSIDIGLKR